MLSEDYYKEILIPIIKKHIPNCSIYLFGSRARSTAREGADLDLALDAGKPIDYKIILHILSDIEDSKMPVFVDVVDLYNVSSEMKKEIIKEGILWEK